MPTVPDDINVRVGDEFKVVANGLSFRESRLHTVGFLTQTGFALRPDRTLEYTFVATEEGMHTVVVFRGAKRHHVQIINAFKSEI